ncbi:MAG: hypothetical protein ABI411_10375 [Tahibacter sp.]
MSLLTHALELDLSGKRVSIRFARDEPTTISVDDVEHSPIDSDQMRAFCSDEGALWRRAASLADRVEESLENHLPGRERMALVAAARWWLQAQTGSYAPSHRGQHFVVTLGAAAPL